MRKPGARAHGSFVAKVAVANEYVRVCPVCERENPPGRARCVCGAALTGVDFSLKRVEHAPPEPEPEPPAIVEHADVATLPAAGEPVVCPYPDCAQVNPPGSERCVYCNRPLHISATLAGARPLPAALRYRYRVVEAFPATGSEADILLVVDAKTGDKAVAKLYRRGIQPDFKLLSILTQSVGSTVVKVIDHGVSDGAAFELLEYVPGGTLEQLMRDGPLSKADLRRVVAEIAEALTGIHAHGILHRDLKPENVLVRSASPLHLALTDFGIASLSAATQHFTAAGRTTKYAAPEVLTGVLDAKSDWWSLGMIVLEAASGRHPFDGLTEQVMNHQLATRPVDVRNVYDDELRQLCRGLLLRDPKRRWGGDEVRRWLEGDPSLAVLDDADGVATGVRPYRFGKTEATTGAELALALAKHWDAARRDMQRGQIARWLEQELHDYNLLRAMRDIQEQKGITDDGRLLRFLLAAAPDLPPVWRGMPVTVESILAQARAAAGDEDDEAARDWLESLWRDEVLKSFADAGADPLRDLDRRWREGWQAFTTMWEGAQRAEERWSKAPRDVGGGARAVSYDDLAYGSPGRLALPPQRALNGTLIVALEDEAYTDALRGEVAGGMAKVAGFCPWFEATWDKGKDSAVGVVVAHAMLPIAQEAAAQEMRRQSATAEARARMRDDVRETLRNCVSEVLALSPAADEDLAPEAVSELLDTFNALQLACQNVERLGHSDAGYAELRRAAEKLASFGMSAQRALAEAEEVHGVNRIFLTPQRLVFAGGLLAVSLLLRVPVAFIVLLAAAALVIGYRWYTGFRATEVALTKLRLFGLHGRTFLRSTDPPDPGAVGSAT